MIRLRGGSGLGDALYLRPIVEHLDRQGKPVTVCSDYPDVFTGTNATTAAFSRQNINMLAHYATASGKNSRNTNQWQDICNSAKVACDLRFTWETVNQKWVDQVRRRADGRPVVLVIGGREPMARNDGYGRVLLPLKRAFDVALEEMQDCFTIRIGQPPTLYELDCRWDLTDRTSVPDLIDLAKECDAVVGQCSFAVPLAEGFDKPLLAVWAAAGMLCNVAYLKTITPQKILSKPSSKWVVDTDTELSIRDVARSFRKDLAVKEAA